MFSKDIGCLARISFHVVKERTGCGTFSSSHISISLITDRKIDVFVVIGFCTRRPSTNMCEQEAIVPSVEFSFDQRNQVASFDLIGRQSCTCYGGESGQDIDVGRNTIDLTSRFRFPRPADIERDSNTSFVGCSFQSLLTCIEKGITGCKVAARNTRAASGHSVIRHENDDRIVTQLPFVEFH